MPAPRPGGGAQRVWLGTHLPFAKRRRRFDAYPPGSVARRARDGAILIVGTASCGLAVVGEPRNNVRPAGARFSARQRRGDRKHKRAEEVASAVGRRKGMPCRRPPASRCAVDELRADPEKKNRIAWEPPTRPPIISPAMRRRCCNGDGEDRSDGDWRC